MTRVLQISKYYYPYYGGTEQVARTLTLALKKENVEQRILCFNCDAESEEYLCHKEETVEDEVDGVSVIRCGWHVKLSSQSISLSLISSLKKQMEEFRPDIVIFHYPNPYVAHFLLHYQDQPFQLVMYWHLDITKQKVLKHLFHGQDLRLIHRSSKILGSTPAHLHESFYANEIEGKGLILPYSIDEERLSISEEEKKTAQEIKNRYQGKMLCFFVGRHVAYKGLDCLIEASKYVSDDIHFIIAGEGELTEKLKMQAAGDSKIEFVGRLNDSTWRSYLWACDVFCFPSVTRNEGFGLALAEGMYYGKPAVTFTIPGSGVNYVNLNGVTGIECPNRDAKAYAAALMKLKEDTALRKQYGEQARDRILNHFTQRQFEENVHRLLKSLQEEKGGAKQ